MCVNCLATWCLLCTRQATYLILAPGVAARACWEHVDDLRESTARDTGHRPTVVDFTPTTTSGGTK